MSQYGAELAAHKGITVHTDALDQEAMQKLIKEHNIRHLIVMQAIRMPSIVTTATAQRCS